MHKNTNIKKQNRYIPSTVIGQFSSKEIYIYISSLNLNRYLKVEKVKKYKIVLMRC